MVKRAEVTPEMSSEGGDEHAGFAARSIPIDIREPKYILDLVTIAGLTVALALIAVAAILGQSQANFFNLPSVLMVVFGTLAVTTVSYAGPEFKTLLKTLERVFIRKVDNHGQMAEQLVNLAVMARKHTVLSLSRMENEMAAEPFLLKAMQMVADGADPMHIDMVLKTESETDFDKYAFAASALRKAGEIAPAMGLIGTLVGLVQMLAQLDDPSKIGPSMAIALLTTFYGAILGTIFFTPLSVKMERIADSEALTTAMIRIAAQSMAKQENPRHLETALNSLLPARERISFF
ncbi:MAG: motility protein A [Pseudobdellovibrionaceae bacterium]